MDTLTNSNAYVLKVSVWEHDMLCALEININPFQANVPFLYPLKTLENLQFSDVYRGNRMGTLTWNGLMIDLSSGMWNLVLQRLKALYLHHYNVYGHQTWQGGWLARAAPTNKVIWPLITWFCKISHADLKDISTISIYGHPTWQDVNFSLWVSIQKVNVSTSCCLIYFKYFNGWPAFFTIWYY